MIKRLLIFFLIAATCKAATIIDRDIYGTEQREFHRSLSDLLVILPGTAEGQLIYWDVSANIWTYADITKLKWNDVTNVLLADTLTDGTFVVSGGEISAGEIINTFGDIDLGGNTLTSWDIFTGQIISHSTSDPQLLLRHTSGIDEAGFYVDSFGDLTITPTRNTIFQPTVDSTIFFQILDADGGTPIFNVDSTNEFVGIGIIPLQKFHVALGGVSGDLRITGKADNSVYGLLGYNNGNGTYLQLTDESVATTVLLSTFSNTYFTSSGNFGIGTTSPNTKLQVVGTAGFGDDSGNETMFSAEGFQTMHGNARISKHMHIGASSFKRGATQPTETYENIFPTISFNAGQDDQAHYTTIVPLGWDDTTDMEVDLHWQQPDDTDNGNVFWKLKYISVAVGEDPAGAGTEITQLSAGNHPQDELLETVFTTKILAANLEHEEDLGLMLWRHGTDGTDDLGEDAELIAMHIHYTMNQLGGTVLEPVTDVLLLDDGASKLYLDDGASFLLIRI